MCVTPTVDNVWHSDTDDGSEGDTLAALRRRNAAKTSQRRGVCGNCDPLRDLNRGGDPGAGAGSPPPEIRTERSWRDQQGSVLKRSRGVH